MGKLTCISLAALLIHLVGSQDVGNVKFGGDEKTPVEGEVDTKISEDDVNSRFLTGLNLNTFAGQVAAASLGTVVGNVGTNLAGNYLQGCSNRGKRSVLMHKIEKRQALEADQKSGNADAEPEVANRLFCPQDFLNPGSNNNNQGGGYNSCDRCSCNDWKCRQDCRKCGNYGWSNTGNQNSGNRPQNTGWSNNNNQQTGWSNNNSGWSNSNSGQSSSYVSCQSCYCSDYRCKNKCSKCRYNNNNYNNYNSGSSYSSGSSYNQGYRGRNTNVKGRTGADSEEAAEGVTVSSAAPVTVTVKAEEAVVFGER